MKKLSYFLSLACAALLASCSSDVEEFNVNKLGNDGKTLTVNVSMPGVDGTRVNTANLQGMVWEQNDKITCLAYDKSDGFQNIHFVDNNFTVNKISDGFATFTGTKPLSNYDIEADHYRFIYRGANVVYTKPENDLIKGAVGKVEIDYLGQVQDAANPDGSLHIKDYLFMYSDAVSEPYTGGAIVLKQQNSVLELNVKNMPAEIAAATDLKVEFFVNYVDGADPIAAVNYKGSVIEAGKKIYLAFDPSNDLYANGKIAIAITADGKGFITETQNSEGLIKDYLAGKIYTITIDDTWTWNEKAASMKTIVEYNFKEDAQEWTSEGSTTLDGGFLKALKNGAIISPVIQLGENSNKIVYNIVGFNGSNTVSYMSIRNVTDNGEWVNLAEYYKGTLSGDTATEVLFMNELDAYKGKEVQFKAHTFSEMKNVWVGLSSFGVYGN